MATPPADAVGGEGEGEPAPAALRWADDAGAVYVVAVNEVGCGYNGLTHATALLRIPVTVDDTPGPPEIVVRDDHPTSPAVIHQVALSPKGFILAVQAQGRARGTDLYWGRLGAAIDLLVRLTDSRSGDSDGRPRIR